MIHHPTKGLLFDNDGVLSDSMASVEAAWGKWANLFSPGFQISYQHHGIRAEDIIATLVSKELFDEAFAKIVQFEIEQTHLTKPMPGAKEITSSLPEGCWTVVTSATPELAKARLTAAGISIPKQLVTGRDVSLGKPNPEPYVKGAEKLGLAIADCVVFEDAPNGVLAGKRSGAGLVVGVGAEALETEAELVIKDLRGISFDGKVLSIPDEIRLR